MAERILSGKIKQLVYTTEELSQSPLSTTVIDNGVLVYEKTSSGQIKCKMGDGNNVWSGLNYIEDSDKMDKINPTGTGSFSMNRFEGSTVGENSVTFGSNNIASGYNSFASGISNIAGYYNRYNVTTTKRTTADGGTIKELIIDNLETIPDDISINRDVIVLGINTQTNELLMLKTTIKTIEQGTDSETGALVLSLTIDETKITDIDNTVYVSLYTELVDTNTENKPFSAASYTYVEGGFNVASGIASHAEGYGTTASGEYSHAEGCSTTVSGDSSHAEGVYTTARGYASHAEGNHTTTSGDGNSHAEGYYTTASGYNSHAEGYYTEAKGQSSHAEGTYTISSSYDQHVQGKYNIEDTSSTYAHIVGGGTSDSNRKNIHTLDWNGNAVFSGDVTATKSDGTEVSLLSLKSTLDSIQVQNFYTGIEAPSNTLGEDGDLYLIT